MHIRRTSIVARITGNGSVAAEAAHPGLCGWRAGKRQFPGRIAIIVLLLLAATVGAVTVADAAEAAETSFRGSLSRMPAQRWEDAFVTGNGRMGAMFFGSPANETLVANHCRLFLPLGNREIVPDLAQYVPELRKIIRDKGYGQAMKFLLAKAKAQGYPGLIPTDPFHPGLLVNIRQPAVGAITDYQRTEDFQTGEVCVRWRDDRGQFQRRLFVSRTDNLIACSLTGPAPCELVFPPITRPLIESRQETTPEWVTYHNVYTKGKGGYDAAVRVIRKDEGRDVLLLIRIVPWKTPLSREISEAWAYSPDHPDFQRPGVFVPVPGLADSSVVAYRAANDAKTLLPRVKDSLAGVGADYATRFASHAKTHAALFRRVALDLGGGQDRAKTTEELLDLAKKEDQLPPALMEKMYDAGRYMLICSAGELPPNLQGIWTGSWTPAWSGDFTLDTNVQAAMASACSANLPELMEGYFRLIEGFYPEWRLNAKRIYGCRGFFSNARASNTCLLLHWGGWDGVFWTAGSGWLASFFTDYAAVTGDRKFLAERVVPLLKETAAFYEDFLVPTEKDGRVAFIPSYNPETDCGVNATMDIAVAREVLLKLIAACRELRIEETNLPKWERLLARLPAYPVSDRGELTEWPVGNVAAGHRHHSQLYPCFQSFDPLFVSDARLRKAAQATVRAKIAGSDGGGEQSSFGRVQCGVSAAFLGMAEEAYGRLKVMAVKRSMNPSLITSHEPNAGIFNTDGNGGIPQIANTMLLQSSPGQLDLLPALPAAWPAGKVTGLLVRGGFTVDIEWKDRKVTGFRIASVQPREVKVRVNGELRTVQSEGSDAPTPRVDPLVYLFDVPEASVSPLSEQGLAKLPRSGGLDEGDCGHRFAGSPVLMNDKIVAVLRKGTAEVDVYSRQPSEVKLCATLQPICDGITELQRTSVTIRQNGRDTATIEVEFRAPHNMSRRITYELAAGASFVKTTGGEGVERLRVKAPCRFAILPDFFGDDMLVDATTIPVGRAELPSENFLLHMIPGGNMMVMTVSESRDNDVAVTLSDSAPRQIVASDISYGKKPHVWVAVLADRGIWHEHTVALADADRTIDLDWRMPFLALWRVDWSTIDKMTESWEMLLQRPDGNYVMAGWFGQNEAEGQSFGKEFGPRDWNKPGRKRWNPVLGAFSFPNWIQSEGQGYLQPLKQRRYSEGGPVYNFAGPVVVYPLDRAKAGRMATPLDKLTVVDLMRMTLGVGPCQYILDLEGQKRNSRGVATCYARDVINAIYKDGTQLQKRAEIEEQLDAAVAFIGNVRERIDLYVQFGHKMSDYLQQEKRRDPRSAAFCDELLAITKRLDQIFEEKKAAIRTPAFAKQCADDFRKNLLTSTGPDTYKQCETQMAAFTSIGGAQDGLVASCRTLVKTLRQRAGIALAVHPELKDVATEIRARTQVILRNPTPYEAPRH